MPAFLKSFFPFVATLSASRSAYCKYDSPILQPFTSSLFLSGLVASLVATTVTRAAGRRASLLVAGVAFLIGTAMTSAAGLVAGGHGGSSPSLSAALPWAWASALPTRRPP